MRGAELRKRRFGRNVFVGLALGTFVAIVFAVTMVKLNEQMDGICAESPERCVEVSEK